MSIMKEVVKNSTWWRKRTTLERCVLLVSALVFVLPSNQIAEGVETTDFKESNKNDLCLSPECVHTASMVLRKIKNEVDPCNNFYQFACGNYYNETPIAEDYYRIDTLGELSNKMREQLKVILTEERPETDPKYLKFPNLLYRACMNTTLIEERGVTPMRQISDSLGGWPVLVGDSWDTDNTWTWQETAKNFRRSRFNFDSLFRISVEPDKKSTKHIITLDQPRLGLGRKHLLKGIDQPFVKTYYKNKVDNAVLFGATSKSAKEELTESLQFEIALANITVDENKKRHNLRTIKQLQEMYPYNNWLDLINNILPEDISVDQNETINLKVPTYFADLGKLLEGTPKRVIANYIMYDIHVDSEMYLPERFHKGKSDIIGVRLGLIENPDRSMECEDVVISSKVSLPLYLRKYFSKESKGTALKIVDGLVAASSQIINGVGWMDSKTKEYAKIKLQGMAKYIGYSNELLDNEYLEQFYSNLEIDPDKYFESRLSLNVFTTDAVLRRLRLPANKKEWFNEPSPQLHMGFSSRSENKLVFPAAVFQAHLFNAQRPKYMNYGAIGSYIGHKIIHGFDDEGRKYDVNGNSADWWQPDSENAFSEKTKCITEQYKEFMDKQTGHPNLNDDLEENIATDGGVKISYLAYKQYVADNGKEISMTGLDYTPEQMFWISFAQTRCTKFNKDALESEYYPEEDYTEEFSVLDTLRNNKDFSNDFRCAKDTPMNPVHKCQFW